MRTGHGDIAEPVVCEILYASDSIVVALIEGVLYVKDDGHYMHPVSIPVGDGSEYLSFENVKKMGVQEYEVFEQDREFRHTLPEEQFSKALDEAIPCLPDDSNTRGSEYYVISNIVSEIFEEELSTAQSEAENYLWDCETKYFEENLDLLRVSPGDSGVYTRNEFIDWFSNKVEILPYEEIEALVDAEIERRSRFLSYEDIGKLTHDISFPEIFLHTVYNSKEYAGAFNAITGEIRGLCDDPFNCGLYTDDEDFLESDMTPDMRYILNNPEEFKWFFVDVEDQMNELKSKGEDLIDLANSLKKYKD